MDRRPILVFSSYILEVWILLHLLMCSSFNRKSGLHCLIFGISTVFWLVLSSSTGCVA